MVATVDRGGGNGGGDGNRRRGCRHRRGGSSHLPRLLPPLLRWKKGAVIEGNLNRTFVTMGVGSSDELDDVDGAIGGDGEQDLTSVES
ncbi:hypothetical protein U1Q18_023672 [Sarracenia purpurea var. burkii]